MVTSPAATTSPVVMGLFLPETIQPFLCCPRQEFTEQLAALIVCDLGVGALEDTSAPGGPFHVVGPARELGQLLIVRLVRCAMLSAMSFTSISGNHGAIAVGRMFSMKTRK